MTKAFPTLALLLTLSVTSVCAQDTNSTSKIDGIYLGAGGGLSFNAILLSTGNYQDNTSTYKSDSLSDSDAGYIIYAGYQFNKIVAVEMAYADYGSFSDTLDRTNSGFTTFSNKPSSFSVYANLGYTFDNGLRPFGQIGLGYLSVNGSQTTKNLDINDGASLSYGFGLEYAPLKLNGFGFRLAYLNQLQMDSSYKSNDNGSTKSTLLTNSTGLLYVGAQYKF